jgi:LmbE family N-acetylglucosaminyl deacetylase
MVIVAHPDDAEYLVSGLVSQWTKDGTEVTYTIVTTGDKGSEDPTISAEQLALTRKLEQERAASKLGVERVLFLGHEDGVLQPTLELRRDLTRVIRKWRPDVVVTFDPTTRFMTNTYPNHPDHRATGDATVDAVFPAARDRLTFPELLEDGLEPHKVRELWLCATTSPDHWFDVKPVLDTKLAALREHASQMNGSDLEEDLLQWSRTWAQGGPYELAESFRRLVLN